MSKTWLGPVRVAEALASVVLDMARGGVHLSKKGADGLPVIIQRLIRRAARAESVALVRPVQPRVVSTAVLPRANGEQLAINFKGEGRLVRWAFSAGAYARNGEQSAIIAASLAHKTMMSGSRLDVQANVPDPGTNLPPSA